MNSAKIYGSISGKRDTAAMVNHEETGFDTLGNPIIYKEPNNDKQQADAARAQAKHSWISSTVTQELLKHLSDKYDMLILEATNNACAYATTKNHDLVISKLVRAHEVQDLVKHIVTLNKPTT